MKKLIVSILSLLLLSFYIYAQNNDPVITSSAITEVEEDAVYSYEITATDDDPLDVLTYSAPILPSWMDFNTSSHILSGIPTNAEVGDHDVTLRVNDGTIDVDQAFTLTVSNTNDPPIIISIAITDVEEDAAYSYEIIATDDDLGDVLTYSAPTLPSWMDFNTSSHILSGNPTNAEVGDHNVTLRVDDGSVDIDQVFVLTVSNTNDLPVITSIAITDVDEDAAYSYEIIATDDDPLDVLTYSAPTLPSWMDFNTSSHILSGNPTNAEVGDHNVTLRVNDGTVNVDQVFTIIVANVNDAPTFTSAPVTSATQDVPYTYTAVAEDIDEDDVLSYTAFVLPGWMAFDEGTHILSGTPADADVGDHIVTIRVNDGTVDVDQSFVITVNNENDPPVFTSAPVTSATQDVPYTYTAVAEDIDEDPLEYTAPVLPTWLTFDTETQLLSGTPGNEDVGDTLVTIRVFDGTLSVDQSFPIAVANVNDAPTFTSTPILSTSQGALYEYTASALDIDENDILSFTAPLLPGWLSFDEGTQLLSGTPGNDDVGDHDLTLTVSDGLLSVDQNFVISVSNANDAPTFTSTPVLVATQDVVYSYTAVVEDIDGDVLNYSAPVLPEWLSFTPATLILTGTPSNADVGDHPVTLRVNDGSIDVDQSFVISVANVNDVPTFISIPLTSALQDAVYTYNLIAEDIDGDILEYSAPVLPSWLSFTAETQILTGTPSNDDVGDHNVTLRIDDGTMEVDQIFIISVANENDGPVFTSIPDTTATEDLAYSYTPTAEDIDGDILTFTAPVLPGWLDFNEASYLVSGTPGNDDVGSHNVTIRVFDGITSVDQSFVIRVSNENDDPTFTSTPITSISQGALYEYTVSAEDIDGDILTYSAPLLPEWLTFNSSTHLLSGTPDNSNVGMHNIRLSIYDGSVSIDQSFSIRVDNVNDPPVFTSLPVTLAKQGVAYNYAVTALDEDGDPLTYSAPLLPGWLIFNSSTHVLQATPGIENLGIHNVTLRVSDGTLSTDQSFNIYVLYGNSAPTFTSDPATYAQADVVYAYTITAEDLDGDPLTYTAPILPEWLSFYPETQLVIGEPRQGDIGPHNITLRISDGTVAADQTFIINVFKANDPPAFTSTPGSSVLEGTAYSYTASAEDIDGDALSFSAPFLPDWLSFDIGTHVLNGTPGYEDAGIYNVTLRVSDGKDSDEQNFTITVEENGSVGIKKALLKDQMLIYPNPTDGRFILELAGEQEADLSLEIFDQTGKLFLQHVFPSHSAIREEFDLSNKPAGIYFLRIYHDSDHAIGKLILH